MIFVFRVIPAHDHGLVSGEVDLISRILIISLVVNVYAEKPQSALRPRRQRLGVSRDKRNRTRGPRTALVKVAPAVAIAHRFSKYHVFRPIVDTATKGKVGRPFKFGPAAVPRGLNLNRRRRVLRRRRRLRVRRLQLSGLIASRKRPVRRREKLVRHVCCVQRVCSRGVKTLPHPELIYIVIAIPRVAPRKIVANAPIVTTDDGTYVIFVFRVIPAHDHGRVGLEHHVVVIYGHES